MRRLDALLLPLLIILSLGAVITAVRIARAHPTTAALRAEVGRHRISELDPELRAHLEGLSDNMVATYYVSNRRFMPSHMKRVERDVVDLLEAMQAVAPERFEYHLVDPDTDPDHAAYASKRRIAPFRERSVERDAWSETLVWSSLALSYGTRAPVVVNGITPRHLPRLQRTLVEHLNAQEMPPRPRIALAVPDARAAHTFHELAAELAKYGDVTLCDLDAGESFPAEADILFWMRPTEVPPARLRELDLFLESGRSVVVAGSTSRLDPTHLTYADGDYALRVVPSGFAAETLYSHFGLRPLDALVLDHRSDRLVNPEGGDPIAAPFSVLCIAPNHDFETWRNRPNGTLLFQLPTALELDGEVVAARGFEPRVLATTSDKTWLQSVPTQAPRAVSAMAEERGEPASKLPLIVQLEHADPWYGRFVALAATSPFEDGLFSRGGVAHWRLARTFIDELCAPERLVTAAAGLERPDPVPELSPSARLGWRAAVILLLPALLFLLALVRGAFGPRAGDRGPRNAASEARPGRPAWLAAGLGLVLALLLVRLSTAAGLRVDATVDGRNSLAPQTEALAARAGELGPTRVELVFSDRDRLPPAMRAFPARVRGMLRDLDRAGADLELVAVDPDALDADGLARLDALGIAPVRTTTRDDEVTTVRTIRSGLVLTRGERSEALLFADAAAFEFLEFRLAFALWRLETGRRPRIAFASDAERPSAAEAFEDQQAGLFATKGTDHYGVARDLLVSLDFDVVNVTPRDFLGEPEVPAGTDLLVWMQPRRSIVKMLDQTVRYLHGGGNVLLAAQHFKILSKQFRGRTFQMSYWPRPHSVDVHQMYFPEIGVELVREVLFDELSLPITVDTEIIGRGAKKSFERQVSAREFQIRASAANFAPDSPVTRNLGDQAFVWANHFRLDEQKLAAAGLEARVLMETSPRTWSYLWTGGYLEEGAEPIDGPPKDEDGEPVYAGRLPLAVWVEGTFPRPAEPLLPPRTNEAGEELPRAPWPEPAPGRLAFFGCTEVFKDERISDGEFRGDQLLVNAVAALALEPELQAVAARRPVVRGFDWIEPGERLRWRSLVLAVPPAALVLVAAFSFVARRRPPRPVHPGNRGGGSR